MEHQLFHPALVHFPIAFYVLEFLLLIFWAVKHDSAYERFAIFTFRLGYLAMLAAVGTGLFDAGGFSGIRGKVRPHFFAALSVVVFYTVRALFWRFGKKSNSAYAKIQLVGAAIGTILVLLTGFLGGEIVYD